jgi:hypothetical protein
LRDRSPVELQSRTVFVALTSSIATLSNVPRVSASADARDGRSAVVSLPVAIKPAVKAACATTG